jgi:hypothetical protein
MAWPLLLEEETKQMGENLRKVKLFALILLAVFQFEALHAGQQNQGDSSHDDCYADGATEVCYDSDGSFILYLDGESADRPAPATTAQ